MTPELKAAWRKLRSYQEKDLIDPNEAILMDAFIDAEARARMAEFYQVHKEGEFCRSWDFPKPCEDSRHTWTHADYRAEVVRELEG